MTVRALINALLDCPMDSEVDLFLREPSKNKQGEDVTGYIFKIDSINSNGKFTELEFHDWRKELDKDANSD